MKIFNFSKIRGVGETNNGEDSISKPQIAEKGGKQEQIEAYSKKKTITKPSPNCQKTNRRPE